MIDITIEVTGPTGSRKTTTIRQVLDFLRIIGEVHQSAVSADRHKLFVKFTHKEVRGQVMPEEQQKFWVVWNPVNRNPLVKHQYLKDAKAEALRLAANNPGQEFYVLRTVGKARTIQSSYEEIS